MRLFRLNIGMFERLCTQTYVDGGVDNDDDDDLIDELEEEEQLSTDRCPLPSISNSSASGRSCLHAIPIKARVILRLVMPVLM